MIGIYMFLAEGFEETEAIATLDVLRRGGVPVKTVSVTDDPIVPGAHGIPVKADLPWKDFLPGTDPMGTDPMDVMIFPGGMPGTKNLAENSVLMDMMKKHWEKGGAVAAICAAPGLVVSQLPDIDELNVTCYDGFEDNLKEKGCNYTGGPSEVDANLITGRGPGCAIDFGLAILSYLRGEEVSNAVRAGLLLPY
ncbi:MAG: DJ-1/PfpI family protein [Bacteroidales bacterium]|nr:DJ-1/PfpI family protein [Bacteroidales bacterium]